MRAAGGNPTAADALSGEPMKEFAMTTRLLLPAVLILASAAPALADDGDFGAYLFRGDCAGLVPEQVVKDLGELELDDDERDAWARVAPDGAPMPVPLRIEEEKTNRVTAAEVTGGGLAVAVTATDSPGAALLACAPLPEGLALPAVVALAENGGSGTEGRVGIEVIGQDLRFTTAAFATGAAPALAQ